MKAVDYGSVSFAFERKAAQLSSGRLDYFVAGDGPPVLYLHGRGGLRKTIPHIRLAERFRLFLPIHPGFDGTPFHPGVASMPALAALHAEFIGAAVGGRCDVVGHSFGGWLAAWLAIGHPDRVDRLVLECPAGLRPGGVPSTTVDATAVERMLYVHPERQPPDDRPPGSERDNRLRAPHYHGGMPLDEALMHRLGDIRSRTLLLYGLEDGLIPMEACHILKARVPSLEIDYVADAAHAIEIDQPEIVAGRILGFLDRGTAAT